MLFRSPSSGDPSGLQWPAAQRADVEARNRGVVVAFESDANPYPIYIWSKAAYWSVTVALSCVVFALGFWVDRRVPRRGGSSDPPGRQGMETHV